MLNRIATRLFRAADNNSNFLNKPYITVDEFTTSDEYRNFMNAVRTFPEYYEDGGNSVITGIDNMNKSITELISYLNRIRSQNKQFLSEWSHGEISFNKRHKSVW